MVALVLVFFFGVFNFAAHKAVLESRHPALTRVPMLSHPLGGRISLMLEFAVLLAAMVMVTTGSSGWAWVYAIYTALTVAGAWLLMGSRL
ncbi:hypothetical protein WSK_3024 [Novosphingobium sp. Rr 2-17]|uniref:hypothetical protein n=1 Tax=Novosphingobium sp. Rr 2-17 TaxID=555793 RepID=UPI000269AB7C|nr:hypothetical protein [Novosphingobium sp. Rr 2-17]EIZ78405.1 hypothetical protein WSK_3024 [Novosphingobium sp. Rr 2-17]